MQTTKEERPASANCDPTEAPSDETSPEKTLVETPLALKLRAAQELQRKREDALTERRRLEEECFSSGKFSRPGQGPAVPGALAPLGKKAPDREGCTVAYLALESFRRKKTTLKEFQQAMAKLSVQDQAAVLAQWGKRHRQAPAPSKKIK